MTRPLAYLICVTGVAWLGFESLRFRQAIRDSLQEADKRIQHVVPESAADAIKVLNSYYEDVYANMPSIFGPAGVFMVGATILFLVRRHGAEPASCRQGRDRTSVDNQTPPARPA